MKINVNHNRDKEKFYAIVSGFECYLKYSKKGSTMLDYHLVFVPIPLRKQGIAGKLTEEAIRYAQKNNLLIIPSCSFVDWYIDNHDQYAKTRVQDLSKIGQE